MNKTERGIQVYQMFKKYLDEKDTKYEAHDDDLALVLRVQGKDLPQPTIIRVLAERSVVLISSPIPGNIPEDKRIDAAVAVAVANHGTVNGCFDLDINDGEICFRVAQSYAGMELSEEFIHYFLGITFLTTDDYNDKFFMLGKGMMSLEQFIEQENAG